MDKIDDLQINTICDRHRHEYDNDEDEDYDEFAENPDDDPRKLVVIKTAFMKLFVDAYYRMFTPRIFIWNEGRLHSREARFNSKNEWTEQRIDTGMYFTVVCQYKNTHKLFMYGGDAHTQVTIYNTLSRNYLTREGDNVVSGASLATGVALADGSVLICGGTEFISPSEIVTDKVRIYGPNGWMPQTYRMHAPLRGHACTLLKDGRVMIVGGRVYPSEMQRRTWPHADAVSTNMCEIIGVNPFTSKLTRPMRVSRMYTAAVTLPDGRVFVCGDFGPVQVRGVSTSAISEIYDPVTDTWEPAERMISPRRGHKAIIIEDIPPSDGPEGEQFDSNMRPVVLVTGGYRQDYSACRDFEAYDIREGVWYNANKFNPNIALSSHNMCTILE
jgi:hypothetical protein